MINSIPTFDDLKQIKERKVYLLYSFLTGGYFRLNINEEGEHNISIDYLEKGFLVDVNYKSQTDYKLNKLYKFNKKNYNGLINLYKTLINALYKEFKNYWEVMISE